MRKPKVLFWLYIIVAVLNFALVVLKVVTNRSQTMWSIILNVFIGTMFLILAFSLMRKNHGES
jgi:CDP-diacylglycerol pyrophosphatase